MGYKVETDYHAYHHSGNRPFSAIDQIIVHDMEVTLYTQAAEAVGRYFESAASGGSTHYGADNDSIQKYLGLNVICWGAPYANTNGIHIEMMGKASWTREQWMTKAKGTIWRTAWLIARLNHYMGHHGVNIPIRRLTDTQVKNHVHGVTTHRQCTRVYNVAGGHTDPGTGFPFDYLLKRAKFYREQLG